MLTEKYTPKAGDKVRATLAENVLVGVVKYVYDDGDVNMDISAPDKSIYTVDLDWQFEQVVSVPSKFGAVIRRADGAALVLGGATETLKWYGPRGWVNDREATFGGFTVLFDGVDE